MIEHNPFDLNHTVAYQAWKAKKIQNSAKSVDDLCLPIADLNKLTDWEKAQIKQYIDQYNMFIYQCPEDYQVDNQALINLGKQLGLQRLDHNLQAQSNGVTALQVVVGDRYIPYTDRPIQWHTDGYYNRPEARIMAMGLHCIRPAQAGGENGLVDHEWIYMQLRDKNPDYIHALMQPTVMTIPANMVDGKEIRAAQASAVFSVTDQGHLHMRYTARRHHIEWAQAELSLIAVAALKALLADESNSLRLTLQAGQGLLCNNVLHNRSRIEDNPEQPRFLYRLRYYDRIDLPD